jgi:hypothetical protein
MKFKKGELVTLSSAGMKNNHNCGYYTGFGIIVEYNSWARFPYTMRWFNENNVNREFKAKEYELKRYKAKLCK